MSGAGLTHELAHAGSEPDQMVRGLIDRFHRPLAIAGVEVAVVFVRKEDAESGLLVPAMMSDRQRVLARASIFSQHDRVFHPYDAEIEICALAWEQRSDSERRQLALLDHELTHLDLKLDKKGRPQWDRLGRPQLMTVPHDAEFGWLAAPAYRWGLDSVEVEQARMLFGSDGGPFFSFTQTTARALKPPPHPYWTDDRLEALELMVRSYREKRGGVVDARARFARKEEAPRAHEEQAR